MRPGSEFEGHRVEGADILFSILLRVKGPTHTSTVEVVLRIVDIKSHDDDDRLSPPPSIVPWATSTPTVVLVHVWVFFSFSWTVIRHGGSGSPDRDVWARVIPSRGDPLLSYPQSVGVYLRNPRLNEDPGLVRTSRFVTVRHGWGGVSNCTGFR